jgi:hypothetical protein
MNADHAENPSFGCEQCYAEDLDPSVAPDHTRYASDPGLENNSHFIVSLRRCKACGQRFISIFTEYVDWELSEDDQYETFMPLTEQEATELVDGARTVFSVGELGATRRYLQSDWPSRTTKTERWTSGAFEVREGY